VSLNQLTKVHKKKKARIKKGNRGDDEDSMPSLPSECCEAQLSSEAGDSAAFSLSDSSSRCDAAGGKDFLASQAEGEARNDRSCDSAGVESIRITGESVR
jgi:hypothetical protein